jgi:hypothetical protein
MVPQVCTPFVVTSLSQQQEEVAVHLLHLTKVSSAHCVSYIRATKSWRTVLPDRLLVQ